MHSTSTTMTRRENTMTARGNGEAVVARGNGKAATQEDK
jgi:hypothetical protein